MSLPAGKLVFNFFIILFDLHHACDGVLCGYMCGGPSLKLGLSLKLGSSLKLGALSCIL